MRAMVGILFLLSVSGLIVLVPGNPSLCNGGNCYFGMGIDSEGKCYCCVNCSEMYSRISLKECPQYPRADCGKCIEGHQSSRPHGLCTKIEVTTQMVDGKPESADLRVEKVEPFAASAVDRNSVDTNVVKNEEIIPKQPGSDRAITVSVVVVVAISAIVVLLVAGGIRCMWKRQSPPNGCRDLATHIEIPMAEFPSDNARTKDDEVQTPLLEKQPVENEAVSLDVTTDTSMASADIEDPALGWFERSGQPLLDRRNVTNERICQALPTNPYERNPYQTFEPPSEPNSNSESSSASTETNVPLTASPTNHAEQLEIVGNGSADGSTNESVGAFANCLPHIPSNELTNSLPSAPPVSTTTSVSSLGEIRQIDRQPSGTRRGYNDEDSGFGNANCSYNDSEKPPKRLCQRGKVEEAGKSSGDKPKSENPKATNRTAAQLSEGVLSLEISAVATAYFKYPDS